MQIHCVTAAETQSCLLSVVCISWLEGGKSFLYLNFSLANLAPGNLGNVSFVFDEAACLVYVDRSCYLFDISHFPVHCDKLSMVERKTRHLDASSSLWHASPLAETVSISFIVDALHPRIVHDGSKVEASRVKNRVTVLIWA